jgi:hypothetical protein
MFLTLGLQTELSLKLLHNFGSQSLVPNMGQQCSESHAQHKHSEQQQNIRGRVHNDTDIAESSLCIFRYAQVVRFSEQDLASLPRNPKTGDS